MPELPEVQVVINFLKTKVLNKQIKEVHILIDKILKNCSKKEFEKILLNAAIKDITRRGKYLLFHLDNGYIWIVHLRMEGKFFIVDEISKEQLKHTMGYLVFDDFKLIYHDTRRFGTFHLIKSELLDSFEVLTKVEIDPLNPNFNAKFLFDKIHSKTQKIKTTLLDQSIVSGIGNIYVDEILFATNIHPETISNKITLKQCEKICNHAREILKASIEHNGTTVHSFKFNGVDSGDYQNYLKIHHPKNKNCKVCNSEIKFIKVNGRGTYLCPKCQKK